jgi:hypothetical protein
MRQEVEDLSLALVMEFDVSMIKVDCNILPQSQFVDALRAEKEPHLYIHDIQTCYSFDL